MPVAITPPVYNSNVLNPPAYAIPRDSEDSGVGSSNQELESRLNNLGVTLKSGVTSILPEAEPVTQTLTTEDYNNIVNEALSNQAELKLSPTGVSCIRGFVVSIMLADNKNPTEEEVRQKLSELQEADPNYIVFLNNLGQNVYESNVSVTNKLNRELPPEAQLDPSKHSVGLSKFRNDLMSLMSGLEPLTEAQQKIIISALVEYLPAFRNGETGEIDINGLIAAINENVYNTNYKDLREISRIHNQVKRFRQIDPGVITPSIGRRSSKRYNSDPRSIQIPKGAANPRGGAW